MADFVIGMWRGQWMACYLGAKLQTTANQCVTNKQEKQLCFCNVSVFPSGFQAPNMGIL